MTGRRVTNLSLSLQDWAQGEIFPLREMQFVFSPGPTREPQGKEYTRHLSLSRSHLLLDCIFFLPFSVLRTCQGRTVQSAWRWGAITGKEGFLENRTKQGSFFFSSTGYPHIQNWGSGPFMWPPFTQVRVCALCRDWLIKLCGNTPVFCRTCFDDMVKMRYVPDP